MNRPPKRNHLEIPYGKKTVEGLAREVARVLEEYRDGLQSFDSAMRELDSIQALWTTDPAGRCILPDGRLPWEGGNVEVTQWLRDN